MTNKALALIAIGIAAVAVVILSNLTVGRSVYAQSSAWQYVVSASASGTASTAWIVDSVNRKVIFCRQSLANGNTAEQVPQFRCNGQPLP